MKPGRLERINRVPARLPDVIEKTDDEGWGRDRRPVIYVSHNDATA
ncbi:MAG: hypothetical protein ACR2RF_11420 [Geminicoccaceae bacterium]